MNLGYNICFDVCLQLLVHEATRTRRIAYTLRTFRRRDEANPFPVFRDNPDTYALNDCRQR